LSDDPDLRQARAKAIRPQVLAGGCQGKARRRSRSGVRPERFSVDRLKIVASGKDGYAKGEINEAI